MRVRYRPFEEALFNIKAFHRSEFKDEWTPFLRGLAGTEIEVRLVPEERIGAVVRADCDLPIFVDLTNGGCVCAHVCEID